MTVPQNQGGREGAGPLLGPGTGLECLTSYFYSPMALSSPRPDRGIGPMQTHQVSDVNLGYTCFGGCFECAT